MLIPTKFAIFAFVKEKIPHMGMIDIEKIKRYFSSQPVAKAWLFGSFARGEEGDDSDVDILVQFNPDARIGLRYFRMINDLEELANRKVDLVEISTLDPFVAPFVNQDKILIYERIG